MGIEKGKFMLPSHLILHVGTHKTATTYIQNILESFQSELLKQDIQYIPLGRLRNDLGPYIYGSYISKTKLRKKINEICTHKNLIFSDENILGSVGDIYQGILYPNAIKKLKKIKNALPKTKITVLIVLRNYSDFIVSLYCEYLRHHPFITFDTYIAKYDLLEMSWLPLVKGITNIFGEHNVKIAIFEDFVLNKQPILNEFGRRIVPLEFNEAWVKRGTLSEKTITILQQIAETISPASARKTLNHWEEIGAAEADFKYDPLDIELKTTLHSMYKREVADIRMSYNIVR